MLSGSSPTADTPPRGRSHYEKCSSVVSAHHFHARTIAGHIKTFNGHLVVKDLGDAESVLRKAKQILDEKYKFSLSTIQIENEGLAEADARELEYRESDGGYTAS